MARGKRELVEINAGSMADIAFLLLIFFLVTTTMAVDKGLPRMLPPPLQPTEKPPPIKERNILLILINRNNQLMVERRPARVENLREYALDFLRGHKVSISRDPACEREVANIPLLGGDVQIPKGVISVQNDRKTEYDIYLRVQNELVAAYNIVRNEKALQVFNRPFIELKDDEKDAIKEFYPMRISEAEPREVNR